MTESNPLFSIIIPTYNRQQFVVRAIKSVRRQDYDKYELIVVNDASTDETRTVISELNDDSLRMVELPVNGGVSVARNKGVEHARGRYVVFLDSDDEMLPGILEAYDRHVSSWPDIELFWSGLERVFEDEAGRVLERDISLMPANSYRPECENSMYAIKIGANRGLALRRESFLSMEGFDSHFRFQDDREFLIRTLKAGLRYASVNQVFVRTYRHQSPSLTRLDSIERMRADARLRECVIQRHQGFLTQSENRLLLRRYSEMLVNLAYKARETELARKYVGSILRTKPWHLKLLTRAIRYELSTLWRRVIGRVPSQ